MAISGWTTKTSPSKPVVREVRYETTRNGMEIVVERKSYGLVMIYIRARLGSRFVSVSDHGPKERDDDATHRAAALVLADELAAAGFRGLTDPAPLPAMDRAQALAAIDAESPAESREVVAEWTRATA